MIIKQLLYYNINFPCNAEIDSALKTKQTWLWFWFLSLLYSPQKKKNRKHKWAKKQASFSLFKAKLGIAFQRLGTL